MAAFQLEFVVSYFNFKIIGLFILSPNKFLYRFTGGKPSLINLSIMDSKLMCNMAQDNNLDWNSK